MQYGSMYLLYSLGYNLMQIYFAQNALPLAVESSYGLDPVLLGHIPIFLIAVLTFPDFLILQVLCPNFNRCTFIVAMALFILKNWEEPLWACNNIITPWVSWAVEIITFFKKNLINYVLARKVLKDMLRGILYRKYTLKIFKEAGAPLYSYNNALSNAGLECKYIGK